MQYLIDLKRIGKAKTEAMKAASKRFFRWLILRLVSIGIILAGVAVAGKYVADWGAEYRFVSQRVVDLQVRWPFRIEERPAKVVVSDVTLKVAVDSLTPIERKIMDRWGYKDGVLALAIFDCGESGLDQYAVSNTGDLGISQIHWPTWKKVVSERFGYTAADMFDVDRNLDVAYMIWDRGDGEEDNKAGSWNSWSSFLNGGYTRCFR